jgi:hypothetical protein
MAVVTGKAYWASIQTPNTKFKPMYTINVVVDKEMANEFEARGHKVKDMEGEPSLVFKRNVTKASGEPNSIPRLLDKDMSPWGDKGKIGNGSTVKVQYNEYAGEGKFGKYVGLDLQAVQVIELVSYDDRKPDGAELMDGEEF